MRQATIMARDVTPPKIDYYFKFHGKRCVRIKGNFWYGGFNLSQNKAAAILSNLEQIQQFVKGGFDGEIDQLTDKEESRQNGDKVAVLFPDC
jgi:hypothetical protein